MNNTDLTLAMNTEARQHEEERINLVQQLDKVHHQLQYTARDKGLHDKRLVELDELVMQLLNLNEVLVSKLTESNTSNLVYKKILGIPKKSITPTVSQDSVKTNVRSHSATRTISSSGGAMGGSNSNRRQTQRNSRERDIRTQDEGPEIDEDVARLSTLHTMYKGLAEAIIEPRYGTEGYGTGISINGNIRDSAMNMRALHQAALASNELISDNNNNNSNKKKKYSSCISSTDFNKSTSSSSSSSLFNQLISVDSGGMNQFDDSSSTTKKKNRTSSNLSAAADIRGGGGGSVMGSPPRRSSSIGSSSSSSSNNNSEYESGFTDVRSPHPSLHSPLKSTAGSNSSSSSKVDFHPIVSANPCNTNNHSLHKVISSLQDEFDSLSIHYRRILLSMQRDPAAVDPNLAGGTTIQHSDELISVIQQLQRKGEQLRTLKASL